MKREINLHKIDFDRYLRLDGIEAADEFLVPVALHVAAGDGTVEDVESSEQRGRTVAVGHIKIFSDNFNKSVEF